MMEITTLTILVATITFYAIVVRLFEPVEVPASQRLDRVRGR
jgi:hypothetical protein